MYAERDMNGFRKILLFPAARAVLALSISLFLSLPVLGAPGDSEPVRIGVLAKRGPRRCLEKWVPTAEYLTTKIPGYSFTIRPFSHNAVCPAVGRGEVDFILANPSLYVELERLYGASRIATLKNMYLGRPYTVYAGVVFCRSDREDIHSLGDLEGKAFMAVEQWSFGGWQMAWRELKEHGIDPYRDFSSLRFGSTHDTVVHAVRDGKADAGTVRADTLEQMASEGKIRLEELRVIAQRHGEEAVLPFPQSTRAYPEWPFVKMRGTSNELTQKLVIALMEMSPESPAAKAARCAGWTIPQNYQPVHECLRELRIGSYKDRGKVTLGDVVRRYWPWLAGIAVLLAAAAGVSAYVMQLNRRLGHVVSGYRKGLAERGRAEEALRESEQLRVASEKLAAIGRLAAGVAHEINNPLTGVLTFAHLLKDKENMDDQDRQDLDLIVHETTRASEIVRGLLDFARERAAMKEPLDVNAVIHRTIQLLGNQKAFQHIIVKEDFEEYLPEVDGDMNQLQQVLVNLCLNACEAMPDGGTLTLKTLAQDGEVLVKIIDTGHGIKEEHLDRIFEPFFTTKPVGTGTGLGLSVSYGIIQEHGGTMEVESEEGKGTTFHMALPQVASKELENRDEPVDQ